MPEANSAGAEEAAVFDGLDWWNERAVLTQITPARFSYIESVAGDLTGRSVLDVGCGGGMLAEGLARAGGLVAGIDVSRNALDAAEDHARRGGLTIDYMLAPAERLPFDEATFDVVIAFDALEHFADLPRAVREIARVLRPGGAFIYDTMNRTLVARVVVIWIGEHLWRGGPPRGTHHWEKFIRPGELLELLADNGLRSLELRGFMPRGVGWPWRLRMGLGPCKGISYVGHCEKEG